MQQSKREQLLVNGYAVLNIILCIEVLFFGIFLSAFTTSLWFALLIYGAVIKFKKDKPVSIAYIIILLFQLAILAFGIYLRVTNQSIVVYGNGAWETDPR